jgi:G:T-mismatch repair DNA endonuclease (very short patch repair protein)
MTENEAKKHVKTLQSTFTIDKCIEKYGEENGKKRWQERQDKWLNTLDSKSEEEKLEILRKKVFHNRVYSKISVDLFEKIDLLDPELKLHTRYATKEGGELQLELPNNILLKPDLVFKNKIIEFYGDYWHCNPNIFESTKIVRRGSKKYRASSIWKIDSWRERILKEAGYDVKIVWENEFKEDPEKIINECYNYLKDDDNKG